jgi:spore coat polysaccharide biosynthesis predicted glycosyltransferase SpsG
MAPEYWHLEPAPPRDPPRQIAVTFGGIDHYDLSSRVLGLLRDSGDRLTVEIVVGPYYENRASIEAAARASKHEVRLRSGLQSLHEIFAACDLAVSAGGIALYELAALGRPTIGIQLWPNQRGNVEGLAAAGALVPLVYADGFDAALRAALLSLLTDGARRQALYECARRTVDTAGTERAAAALVNHLF